MGARWGGAREPSIGTGSRPSPGPRSETQRRADDGVIRGAAVAPGTRPPLELLELLHDGVGGNLVGEAPADALPDDGARFVNQEYRRRC